MNQTQHSVRQYGQTPSKVAVLHGGPGGAGEVEPFARELGRRGHAVLEPFQTAQSVDGQVDELRSQIEQHCTSPATIIGWSWGAWLGCLFAAKHPALVRKLILIGSGPFEPQYAANISATKASRLTDDLRTELATLRPERGDANHVSRFIELNDMSDTYARDASPQPTVTFDAAIHAAVWPEGAAMRESGALKKSLSAIRCAVFAFHGDHDPRPFQGVQEPLQTALPSASFTLLERCGHKPWQETHARDTFYDLIEAALRQ